MYVLSTLFTVWGILQVVSTSLDDLVDDLVDYDKLFGVSPRRDLEFPELTEYDGYPSETYSVTTKDGYCLCLFRIPPPKSCTTVKEIPLIFMHGLYLSGDDCIIPGPGKAHCYVYSDNCYDVWVPNVRGNRYSRKHISLDPDKDPEYWNFAFDTMAQKDLPAIIDFVLETTGKKQLNYVCHSQGATILLLLCAKQPEYNAKIKMGYGLSVTAWLDHSRFPILSLEAIIAHFLVGAHNHTNAGIFQHGDLVQTAALYLCGLGIVQYPACTLLIFTLMGYNNFYISPDVVSVFPGHIPAGTSLKNFLYWGQIQEKGFTERDYGEEDNLKIYGQPNAPVIDLSNVTMKWCFIASPNDRISDPKDVQYLSTKVSRSEVCVLKDKYFEHIDYIYADVLPDRILSKVLRGMETDTCVCD